MTIKEQADELVARFRPHAKIWNCYHALPEEENHPLKCAIIAQEREVKLLNKLFTLSEFPEIHRQKEIEAQELLNELKSRL